MFSREHLGLFDTPPNPRETRFAVAIVGVLFVAFVLVLPVCNRRLHEVGAFIPSVSTGMFVGELIIAALLYAQAAVFRSHALTVLASAYVLTALLLVPYALTFPGAFAHDGLFGAGVNTSAWLMIFRRLMFPLSIIVYVVVKRRDGARPREAERPPPQILWWVSGAVALAAAATLLATIGQDLLPPMFAGRSEVVLSNITVFNFTSVLLVGIALVMLFLKRSSILDVWLLVAVAAWMMQAVLNLPIHARFTVGWYALLLLMLFSNLFLLLALIGESNRLYVRLALSTSARSREREARMMSMDAVAATIFHEVGQPLAAVTLSASAGLSWLTREHPVPLKAIKSLRDTLEAGQRAKDVVKSIRATLGKGSVSEGEFSLNDLVRECARLLEWEFATQRVSLQLVLDEALPLVIANRVQIQRVLVNLLTNAIESIAVDGRRARRIAVRSSTVAGDYGVLLEVSDTGDGIAPEAMEKIFEPFFTTKPTGTGLGLSLSRTIVEGHGGRLWASQRDHDGATLHLQLRSRAAPEPQHADV